MLFILSCVNNKDEMSRFLTGVLEDLEEDLLAALLRDNMDLGWLMVHAKEV